MTRLQQGDVVLMPTKDLPPDVQKHDAKNVLAYGEVTGHAHRIHTKESGSVMFLRSMAKTYLQVVKEGVELKHEEHNPVSIPPGIYEYGIVLEYDYDTEESRRVAD